MSFRLGELFCGAGGLAYGAIHADIGQNNGKIVHGWASDCDEAACKTYRRNICPDAPQTVVCEDVRRLPIRSLGAIDALSFGFPCNDYSLAGDRHGMQGRYGSLYMYGIEALNHYRPQWFLAENVGGLKSADGGRALATIANEMKTSGYRVYPHLYAFEKYGIPQSRHRIVIVGIRNDLPHIFRVPAPTNVLKTCREAICEPPIAEGAANHEKTRQLRRVAERLGYIGPGENAFTAHLPSHLRLNVGGARISQIYRRLDPRKPAYTVTGSGGGGTHMYHWEEPRALTNRERARLQTFPDSFVFEGTKAQARKQIGMAVPPLGAKMIFEAILKTFASMEYEYVPCNIALAHL